MNFHALTIQHPDQLSEDLIPTLTTPALNSPPTPPRAAGRASAGGGLDSSSALAPKLPQRPGLGHLEAP